MIGITIARDELGGHYFGKKRKGEEGYQKHDVGDET